MARVVRSLLRDERVRFLLIGGVNTLNGYVLFVLFNLLTDGAYLLSLGVSYVIATAIAFALHRRLTFQVTGRENMLADAVRFSSVYVVMLAVNFVLLPVLVEIVGWPPLVAQAVVIVITTALSYIGHKFFSFRRDAAERDLVPSSAALRRVGLVGVVVLGAWAAWVAVNVLVNPFAAVAGIRTPAVVALVVLLVLMAPAIWRMLARVARWYDGGPRLRRVGFVIAVVVVLGALQAGLAVAVLRPSGFDSAVVLDAAAALAHGTRNAFGLESQYFEWYPTNVGLLHIEWAVAEVVTALGFTGPNAVLAGAAALNLVALWASTALLTAAVRLARGTTAVLAALLLAVPFVLFSPWLVVPYTDVLGMPFPLAIILLALLARRARTRFSRIVLWTAIGIAAVVGYNIKPTVVFALVAVLLIEILSPTVLSHAHRDSLRRRALAGVAVVLLVTIPFALAQQLIITAENRSGALSFNLRANDEAFPPTHFLNMGAGGNGGYSDEDVLATRQMPTPSDKFWGNLSGYLDRVAERGPVGYTGFLATKLLTAGSDGSFGQWGEGGLTDKPYVRDDEISRGVQAFWDPNGEHRTTLMVIWQSLWIAALVAIAAGAFTAARSRLGPRIDALQVAAVVTAILLIAYLLLFESRARYLYLFAPMFVIAAVCGWQTVMRAKRHPRYLR